MAETSVMQGVITLLTENTMDAAILIILGFLICHLFHAIRYGFFGGFETRIFDKIKKFFKVLLFLKIQ